MMGTSLLTMPWALQQAGLALGVALMLTVGALALYTAYRVVQSADGLELDAGPRPDFQDVCRFFWGRAGELVAVGCSVVVLLGGVVVYWVLMSNFLFHTGAVVHDALQMNSSRWIVVRNASLSCDAYRPLPHRYIAALSASLSANSDLFGRLWSERGAVPFYLALIAFPLLNFKSPTFFTKFNGLGTVSVVYLLAFVSVKAFDCGIHLNVASLAADPASVQLARWRFPALTGTLSLSYFIHNAILSILRNQRHPQNNARDLTIGYCLTAFTYLFLAVVFFAAFPTFKSCISDNFLNNFASADVLSVVARLFLLLQMLAILPLLMYLIRAQLSYTVTGHVYPGLTVVCLMNLCVISICIFFAVFFPSVGTILRFVGAFSGLMYVFALPSFVHMKRLQLRSSLSNWQLVAHVGIVLIGIANFIAQFLL